MFELPFPVPRASFRDPQVTQVGAHVKGRATSLETWRHSVFPGLQLERPLYGRALRIGRQVRAYEFSFPPQNGREGI